MQTTGSDTDIRVNGIIMCYDDLGKGFIPIIFIHGFPFDKSSWKPQLDDLQKKFRVIAYDIRGFGKSAAGDDKQSIVLFADDLILLMDALQIKKAVVCGFSMGGYILLNAVNRYPERFAGLILSDTQCNADSDEGREKRYKTIKQIESGRIDDFASGFVKNVLCKETIDTKPELVDKIKNIILSNSEKSITGTLNALAQRWETCSVLVKIKIPVLILCGAEDTLTPPAQSEFLHKNIPGATFYLIEKAGHLSNLEQPEEFNRRIINFMTTLNQ
jgi:3-oxoadipate enol-lactonase